MLALTVAVASAAGFAVSGLLAAFRTTWGNRARVIGPAVAGGLLLAVGFGRIFPEALAGGANAAVWGFVAGFVLLLLVEASTHGHTHHGEVDVDTPSHSVRPFLVGLALHNVADGIAIGLASELPRSVSGAIGLGVFIHQVPVGLSVAAVLASSHLTGARTARAVLLLAATIPAATAVVLLLPSAGGDAAAALQGGAAGVLTYLSAAHLLPEVQREQRTALPAFVFAATVALATGLLQTVFAG